MSPADFTRPGSLYGAVDLGARKQALEAQARREAAAQAGGPGAAQATVVDVTTATFNAEVVERSATVPVIVEATVSRAEQVQQFSQTLEKLAAEAGGAWVLARVDVQTNPDLAQMLRLRVVPTVYLALQGQLMPLFEGPVAEPQLRQLLKQVFDQLGIDVSKGAAGAEPPADPDLLAATKAMDAGDYAEARAAYERVLARSPNDETAKIGLARVGLYERTQGLDPATVLREAAEAPDDGALQCRAADVELRSGAVQAAFERMVGLVRRTSGEERDKARLHLLGLFDTLPGDDPLVIKYRRALANALF